MISLGSKFRVAISERWEDVPHSLFYTHHSLVETRRKLCQELSLGVEEVELSMGMSSDFEQAIAAGSTNVRVGSVIFGSREPKV